MGGVVYLLKERRKEGSKNKGGKKYNRLGSTGSDDEEDDSFGDVDMDGEGGDVVEGAGGANDKIEMSNFDRAVVLGGEEDEFEEGVNLNRYKMGMMGQPRSRTNSTEYTSTEI